MKLFFKALAGFMFLGLFSGCTSAPTESANSANAGNAVNVVKIDTTSNSGTSNTAENPAAANVTVDRPVTNSPIQKELAAAPIGNSTVKVGKEDIPGFPGTAGKKITVIKPNMSEASSSAPSVPAPDDSEISSVMGEGMPVETRTFKSNRYITKIEKTTVTPDKDVRVKVFLKTGATKEFAAGSLDVMKVNGDEIARAVGIQIQPEEAKPMNPDKTTKEDVKKP